MKKSANLTAVLTAGGVLLFLAPVSAQTGSTGSSGSSSQSGQTGTGTSGSSGQSGQTGTGTSGSSGQSGRSGTGTTERSDQSSTSSGQSSSSSSQSASESTLSAADRRFVMNAAEGGMAEVELGRLAAEKGSNDKVKQFAQRMVDDHSKANDELKSLASQKGITLPDQPSAKDKAMHDRLSKMSGEQFDNAYMREMERDHKKDVSEFRRASERAKDPEIKQWASKTLSTLEEHDRMAHETMAALRGESGTKASGTSTDRSTDRGDQPTSGEQKPREREPK